MSAAPSGFIQTPRSVKPRTTFRQIVQVTGQPVHRVADHRVTLTHIARKLFQLRPVEVLAGCFVHKTLVEMDAFELTQLVLIERADAQVAYKLTGPTFPFCHSRL